jgi:conjugative transfer region protein TrbK
MLGRPVTFRVAAILLLVAALIAAVAASYRRAPVPVIEPLPAAAPAPDQLSAELRRCSALGPQDAEDARCTAVWEENRQRFLGRPARPLPPEDAPEATAPTTSATPAGPGGVR